MTIKHNATKHNGMGPKRILKAYSCSIQGFKAALSHEAAFSQELLLTAVMLPIGLWAGNNGTERAILIGCLFLVLITELLNSAIEAVVDRIGPEHHELSGRAKDLGSAAVFLALLNGAVVWLLILCG
ncbi:diacylglycerol kinase (ATP) [Candidatus Electrothrix aarhusensis]|jgi:diacylglycerol kinase (ATP)|uniref:Diacylglycerol kinase n=1 Tax=Candidatus Electrothrix aarhusensis TaxID=1859131 RepID=A0A444IU28_9BACT|nr:diacylglycerol kinase (ATP) [Candidatus Electrothrix aarhusensis]